MKLVKALLALIITAACAFAQFNVTSADYVQQGKLTAVSDAGASDTYTGCPSVPIRAYAPGMSIDFRPNTANTGAASVNVCGLGAKAIKTVAGADPADGSLAAGKWYKLVYDGTNFQIVGGIGSSTSAGVSSLASGTDTTVTCTGGVDAVTGNCAVSLGPNAARQDGNNTFEGVTSFPASSTQTISSSTSTILCNATRVAIQAASPYTLSGVATIADPVRDGQVCIVQNVGSNDITLTDGSTQNLKLGVSTVAISAGQPLLLIWDQTTGLWTRQVSAGTSSPSGGMTNICSGGSTTTYTQATEPSTGVAPSWSCTIPPNTFSATGKTVECYVVNRQISGGDGVADGLLNIRAYLGGASAVSLPDANISWLSGKSVFVFTLMASGDIDARGFAEGTSTGLAAGTVSAPATSGALALEFRPWMTTIDDDSFAIQSYSCWVRP